MLDVLGIADDGDVRLCLQQVGNAPSDDLVVVEQEDADRVLRRERVYLGHVDPLFHGGVTHGLRTVRHDDHHSPGPDALGPTGPTPVRGAP